MNTEIDSKSLLILGNQLSLELILFSFELHLEGLALLSDQSCLGPLLGLSFKMEFMSFEGIINSLVVCSFYVALCRNHLVFITLLIGSNQSRLEGIFSANSIWKEASWTERLGGAVLSFYRVKRSVSLWYRISRPFDRSLYSFLNVHSAHVIVC